MAQKVTLGGDRLGSGNKNKIALRNYERSTHNLSKNWASSMGAGILYPFMCIPAMRGDAFEIDLEAACRTIPTKGPLFGSFKMQLDIFQCPMRLYQAVLHNNPTAIGLKMSQVKFPILNVTTKAYEGAKNQDGKFNNSCLLKYLGMSGLGRSAQSQSDTTIGRNINAIPVLAYYDIFKNYYSNKQEDNAYVINPKETSEYAYLNIYYKGKFYTNGDKAYFESGVNPYIQQFSLILGETDAKYDYDINDINASNLYFYNESGTDAYDTIENLKNNEIIITMNQMNENSWFITLDVAKLKTWFENQTEETGPTQFSAGQGEIEVNKITSGIVLKPFALKNIDTMRMELLSHNNIGTPFYLRNEQSGQGIWGNDAGENQDGLPYSALFQVTESGDNYNKYALNGLLVKTYQSDLYNNWINTEWIDGENGIAEITKISTSGDAFKIDALNLAEKLYNMLNRVAVSGGTYEDWQDAVYTQSPRRHIESPVYLGGMSSEVVFEEIVQSAPAGSGEDATQLGTLGGRGTLMKRKGGNVDVKVDEASFIIGIVSLTPRIYQTQGNKWYLTELQTMDDLHKPALDGIGFQDLIGEQMAWFDTVISPNTSNVMYRSKVGKVPAWINYMTDVDEAYGDFADDGEAGKNFMILDRHYDQVIENGVRKQVKDFTTYIDPAKYNYAFAYTELDAQNFWVQIKMNIRARRLMSAKQIPNI